MNDPLGLFDSAGAVQAATDPLGLFEEDKLGTKDSESLGKKSLGMLEAGANLLAGTPAYIAGGVAGAGSMLMGRGLEKSNETMEAVRKFNFGAPEVKARSEAGQQAEEALGNILGAPGRYAAKGVGAIGGSDLAQTNAQIGADVLMNFLPLHAGGKGAKAVGKRLAEAPIEVPKTDVQNIIEAEKAKQAPVAKDPLGLFEQQDLFGMPEEGQASPYNAGQAGVTEPITPARQARQQELPLRNDLPAQMQATPEGVLAGSEAMPDIMQRRNIDTDRLMAELDAQRPKPQENVQGPEPLENRAPIQVTPEGVAIPPGAMDQGALLGQQRAAETVRAAQAQAALEQRRANRPHDVTADLSGQADLFSQGNPNPYTREGQWHVDENGMPIRSDLSMEVQNVQDPLQRNFWGDELGPSAGQDLSLSAAIDSMPKGPARDMALARFKQQGHVYFGESERQAKPRIIPTGRGFTAMRDGKEVGRLESNMSPEQNKQLRAMGENIPATIDIVKVDPSVKGTGTGAALYKAFYDAHEGNVLPSGKTTQDAWNVWKRNYPEKVGEFIKAEAARIQDGAPLNQVLSNITDPQVRDRVSAIGTGKDPATNIAAWQPGSSFNTRTRGQGGGLYMGDGKKLDVLKGIPGMKGKLGHLEPIPLSPEQVMQRSAALGDISGTIAQRMLNLVSKGSLYNAPRINNPRYTYATQRLRKADNMTNASIRDMIHGEDGYATKLRELPKEDYVKTAHLLMEADKAGVRPTPESMRGHGMSEQAIAMVEAHYGYANKLFEGSLKPAADAAGIKNVDQRVAYAADRLQGDFRVPVMQGEKQVGWLTANTKPGLELKKRQLQAMPEWKDTKFLDTQYKGGGRKGGSEAGISQLYQWLAEQEPDVAKFGEVLQNLNQKMATDYLGAKRHTERKQGEMFGFQGKDPTKDAVANAKDFWDSQVKYGENVIKWGEMSKALEDVKGVMNDPATPKLNDAIKAYTDQAMGRNPNGIGRMIDGVFDAVAETTGLGTKLGKDAMLTTKKLVGAKLLTFSPGFYESNIIQPVSRLPEAAAFLRAHGLDVSMFGADSFYKGMMDVTPGLGEKSPLVKAALKYADANHVYSSDLFETSNQTRKGMDYLADKTTVPAARLESFTRQSFYMAMVDALHKNGYTPDNGLFGTAHNLTDMFMNNYSPSEKPLAASVLGSAPGKGAYNLMSYKVNEISRMIMHLENVKDKGMVQPLAANLMTQVALGGIMGTMLYKEADWLIRAISETILKEPTSLTNIMLKTEGPVWDYLKYGVPSQATGVDMTQRMGIGNLTPTGVSDLMPGAGSLLDMGVSIGSAVKNPSEYNVKKAIRDTLPTGPQSWADRAWFSKHGEDAQGNATELGLNQNTVKGQVFRNDRDKLAKNIGQTGLNESMAKTKDFEQNRIDKWYEDKQKDAVQDLREALLTQNAKDKQDAITKFVRFRGDPSSFNRTLGQMALDGSIDENTRQILAAQANRIGNAYKLRDRAK